MKRIKVMVVVAAATFALAACSKSSAQANSKGMVRVEGATIVGKEKVVDSVFASGDDNDGVFISGRTVTLSDFYMCDHEVTQDEYMAIMGANPSFYDGTEGEKATPKGEKQGDRPVDCVSWFDAICYCNKRSLAENLTPCYSVDGKTNPDDWGYVPHKNNKISGKITCDLSANGYRLPTEAEWEYAAFGGKDGLENPTIYAGTSDFKQLKKYAWCDWEEVDTLNIENHSGSKNVPHAVKTKAKNGLGLYDMSGNVFEWCWDKFYTSVTAGDGGKNSVTNPLGSELGWMRVIRGGDAESFGKGCTCFHRYMSDPANNNQGMGFRVARSFMSD